MDKDAYAAAERMLLTKTGIRSPYLEQLATFTGTNRDSRGWAVSIAYFALVPAEVIESVGHADVQLLPVDKLKKLPFVKHGVSPAVRCRARP
jgi:8-oxo-dGTP diphosphatase